MEDTLERDARSRTTVVDVETVYITYLSVISTTASFAFGVEFRIKHYLVAETTLHGARMSHELPSFGQAKV